MSGLSGLFNWVNGGQDADSELPDIFPLSVIERDFVSADTETTFQKILTDVIERTHGLSEDLHPLLWDNCVKSSKGDGLISMLAKAMTAKSELYLVYDSGVGIVREATQLEKDKIRADYEKAAKSSTGTYISFKQFKRTDMIKLYASLEYCAVASLYKSMNVSKSVQFKIKDLRASTSVANSADTVLKAKAMATHLSKGKDILLDAGDSVDTTTPNMEAAEKAVAFLNQKRAHYLGMPASYINGEQAASGLSDTGKADSKAVDRGLRSYFFAIVKPTLESIFGASVNFKSIDMDGINSALETIKTFDIAGDDYLTPEEKRMIIAMQLNLPQELRKLPEVGGKKDEPKDEKESNKRGA